MTTIRRAGADDLEPNHVNVDLTRERVSSAKEWIETANAQKNLVREFNAGSIAKILAGSISCLLLMPILIVGLITGKTVLFGLTATEMILFAVTLLLSLMTFLGKRTTPMLGIMHLALFVVFIMLIFNP